jgi:hypothetical protein
MEMTTRISKGRDGWEANTQLDMQEANRVLIVTTRKMTGGMVTRAMVNTDSGDGFLSWNLFGDYSSRTVYKGARATEKTVTELHQIALDGVEQTLAAALAHYAAKEMKVAA